MQKNSTTKIVRFNCGIIKLFGWNVSRKIVFK